MFLRRSPAVGSAALGWVRQPGYGGHVRRSGTWLKAAALTLLTLTLLTGFPGMASATSHNPFELDQATQFVLNTFSFLIWGALVMWMCAGFTMLESGSVRTKNASMICLKNVGIYSIAALSYYLVGFNLMHVDVDSVVGTFQFLHTNSDAESTLIRGTILGEQIDPAAVDAARAEVAGSDVASATMSFWFFQMVFVATAASIVSGAIAERMKLFAFFVFTLMLTAFIYPIVGSWVWGGGWLAQRGFEDFAGATVVHNTGGWAALAGLLVIGPRLGKFRRDGSVRSTPPSNVLLVTLGVLILWLGWFGFNAGSGLMLGSVENAVQMAHVVANTNLAAAAGAVAALAVLWPIFRRMDLAVGLNGALAGLVAITAAPYILDHHWAVIIGLVAGVLCALSTKLLERLRIDDVVGALPVHLVGGIWGTLAASFTTDATFGAQLTGMLAVGAFVFVSSLVVWIVLDFVMGLRVSPEVERIGQDAGELGIEAHPEFVLTTEDYEEG